MTPTPVVQRQFGGLDLAGSIYDPNRAVDLLNVRVDDLSAVRSRSGYTLRKAQTIAAVNPSPLGIARYDFAGVYVVVWDDDVSHNNVVVIDPDTWTVVDQFKMPSPSGAMATMNGKLYLAGTDPTDGMWWIDYDPGTGVFSHLATSSVATSHFLAASPIDSRLVMASSGLDVLDVNNSRVFFSAPASSGFNSDDFVMLDPDDGQRITGLVCWRGNTFVFKQSKFFVFGTPSVDATGGNLFNYRPVDVGIGCDFNYCAAGARDGVYFLATDGVYRTSGDVPQLVSGPLQPLFDGETAPFFGGSLDFANPSLTATADRIYLTAGAYTFHYDLRNGQWGVDQFANTPVRMVGLDDPRRFLFADSSSNVYEFDQSFTTDNGTAISWSRQGGWDDLGVPASDKKIKWSSATGTGSVTVQRRANLGTTDANAGTLTLGSTPALVRHKKSWAGRLLSTRLSGTSAGTVNEVMHLVDEVRPPGISIP